MKKILIKIFLLIWIISLIISNLTISINSALDIPWVDEIKDVSISPNNISWDIQSDITWASMGVLYIIKIWLQAIFIIFLVYSWAMMIMSMWSDDEKLSSAKRQLWYMLIAIIFINIPWTIYDVFNTDKWYNIDSELSIGTYADKDFTSNFIFNPFNFWITVDDKIIWFIKIFIFIWAIFMIIFHWIRILLSRWNEEKFKEAIEKIKYSFIALIFIWVIEIWKQVIFEWSITKWLNLFHNLANLALFFIWPVSVFFISLAWYYYIISAWDEEKTKKAKSIIINTILASLILLASYTFLLDIWKLFGG